MLFLRRSGEDDQHGIEALSEAVYPEYRGQSHAWRPAEQYDGERLSRYGYVATDANTERVVGYGAVRTSRLPYARLDLMVHPTWRRHGVGGSLLELLLADARALHAITLQARARADNLDALAFLAGRGFEERHRMYGLRLVVADAELTPFLPVVERVGAMGIVLSTYAHEREHDRGYLPKLHALQNAVLPDWSDPDPAPIASMSLEDFARRLQEADPLPDALYIARCGEEYVGYSGMFALGTAVHPAYRGRGLATALKVRTIEYAKRLGYESAITCTANPAMLAINEKLGYRRELTEVRLIRRLKG